MRHVIRCYNMDNNAVMLIELVKTFQENGRVTNSTAEMISINRGQLKIIEETNQEIAKRLDAIIENLEVNHEGKNFYT